MKCFVVQFGREPPARALYAEWANLLEIRLWENSSCCDFQRHTRLLRRSRPDLLHLLLREGHAGRAWILWGTGGSWVAGELWAVLGYSERENRFHPRGQSSVGGGRNAALLSHKVLRRVRLLGFSGKIYIYTFFLCELFYLLIRPLPSRSLRNTRIICMKLTFQSGGRYRDYNSWRRDETVCSRRGIPCKRGTSPRRKKFGFSCLHKARGTDFLPSSWAVLQKL